VTEEANLLAIANEVQKKRQGERPLPGCLKTTLLSWWACPARH